MPYRLGEVRLRNFKSHVDTRIVVPQGSVALLGENGAGKSSILEAVRLALAVDRRRTRGLAQLVNERRGGSFSIKLTLEPLEHGAPQVEALVEAGGGRPRYILKVGGKLVASGIEAYRREMNKVLGLQYLTDPASFIERAVIVRQGGLQAIAEKMDRGRELREEIEAAIGIPDYKEAIKKLDQARVRVGSQEAGISEWHLKRVARSLQEARDKAATAKRSLQEAKKRLKDLEEEAKWVHAEIDRLLEEKARLEAGAGEAEELEKRIAALEARRARLGARIRRLEEELEEARRAREELPRLEALAGLGGVLDRIQELERLTAELRVEEDRLSTAREALEEREKTREAYNEHRRLTAMLEELIEREREARSRLAGVEAKLAQARERRRRLEERLGAALREASRILGTPLQGVDDLARGLAGVEEKLSLLGEELARTRNRIGALQARVEEDKRLLEVLHDEHTTRCPVCGRELTEEHAREIRSRIAERLRRGEEELRRLKEKLRRLEEEEARLRVVRDRLARLLQQARDAEEEAGSIDTLRLEEEHERLGMEARRLREEIAGARRRLEELEPLRDRYIWALRQVNTLKAESLEDVEDRLAKVRGERRRLEEELEEARAKVLEATKAGSMAEARARIRDAIHELGRLRELAGKARTLEEEVSEARRELEELEGELSRARERLEEARRARIMLREVEERLEELAGEKKRLEEEIQKAQGEIARLEAVLEEAEERIRDLEKLYKIVKAGAAARRILERLQETLYKRSLMALEEEMAQILESFNLDPARVEIREDHGGLSVKVLTRSGGERSVSMLSGGERTSVALAYVLALNRMMRTNIGFLALDEPTSELDQERRQVLVDLVSRLTGPGGLISQLIIVTHHEDVMDRVETVCRVRKTSGQSRVECSGGA